jgi:hypothetical protein
MGWRLVHYSKLFVNACDRSPPSSVGLAPNRPPETRIDPQENDCCTRWIAGGRLAPRPPILGEYEQFKAPRIGGLGASQSINEDRNNDFRNAELITPINLLKSNLPIYDYCFRNSSSNSLVKIADAGLPARRSSIQLCRWVLSSALSVWFTKN